MDPDFVGGDQLGGLLRRGLGVGEDQHGVLRLGVDGAVAGLLGGEGAAAAAEVVVRGDLLGVELDREPVAVLAVGHLHGDGGAVHQSLLQTQVGRADGDLVDGGDLLPGLQGDVDPDVVGVLEAGPAHRVAGLRGELGTVFLGVADLVLAAARDAHVDERRVGGLAALGRGHRGVVELRPADLVTGHRLRRGDRVRVGPRRQGVGVGRGRGNRRARRWGVGGGFACAVPGGLSRDADDSGRADDRQRLLRTS